MTREELLKKYIEIITTIDKKEVQLNDICFNWEKCNQTDENIAKKLDNIQNSIDELNQQAEIIHQEYHRIQQEDAFKRRVIMNQKGDFKVNEIIAGIEFKVANNLISPEDGQELIKAVKAYNIQPSTENITRI